MLRSLPDVLRSLWSKPANETPPQAAGRKRKREENEWEDDPDVQIIKVEKKRKTEHSFWNILNLPSKMADWIRMKPRSFSDEFFTRRSSNRNARETKSNGGSNRIRHLNGNRHSDNPGSKTDARLGDLGHNRGLLNGELSDSSHNTSRLSDRASSAYTSCSRPLKVSTSSLCIRLKEREEYEKLLKMHSRLVSPQSVNAGPDPVESDVLSISSSDSSNVSLLGTSQCLFLDKHTNRDSFSIPHHKTTPRRNVTVVPTNSSMYHSRRNSKETMGLSLSSLIARQRKKASLPFSQSRQSEKERQNEKVSSASPSVSQKAIEISDEDETCIIVNDKEEVSKPIKLGRDHLSSKKGSSDTVKAKSLDFMNSMYTRDGYIQEMQKSRLMHSEQWKRQVADEELKAKAYAEKRRAQGLELERMLKHQMRIFEEEPEVSEEIFIEKEEEEEEEEETLPELTDSMMELISAAMCPHPPGEVLSDAYSLKITRRDLATLKGLNWLNDEVINFYMNMLIDRGKQDDRPSVYAFNTFFYPKIMSGGHSAVKRWTKKVDLFAMHYILIPVHLGMHWCLCVVNIKDKIITYYDSMGSRNNDCLKAVLKYINDESVAKKQTAIDESEWSLETATDNPQQMNGSDCGMFTCKYADYVTREKEFTFSQNDMPYFRLRMVHEIITQKLLQ